MSFFDVGIIFGIIVGIIAYIVLYSGKGFQKHGLEGLKEKKTIKGKHSWVWILGTVLTTLYMFIQWGALFFAPINLIAPLEGVGLVFFLFFSYYFLKEEINKIEILGVALILGGVVLITIFNINTGKLSPEDFYLINFLLILVTILIVEGALIIFSILRGYKAAGLIIGSTAGTFMAFQTVTKRITVLPILQVVIIASIFVFVFGAVTLLVTQFALLKARANQVVPCFTSASIVLATFTGSLALSEFLLPPQIVGIVLVVVGVIFLTSFKKEEDTEESIQDD